MSDTAAAPIRQLDGLERMRSPAVSINSHHYISLSLLNRWVEEVAVPAAHGEMLDYGCGGQPYRALFETRVSRYVGADVSLARGIVPDVLFEPGKQVPLADQSFDTIASTQVLEHVADPHVYLSECDRLLRSRGTLLISVPMQWRHHEVPFDYWRFTRYGLINLLESHRFEIESIVSCGGTFALLGQILTSHLDEHGFRKQWAIRLINRVALWLDRRHPDSEETLLWMCVARKVPAS